MGLWPSRRKIGRSKTSPAGVAGAGDASETGGTSPPLCRAQMPVSTSWNPAFLRAAFARRGSLPPASCAGAAQRSGICTGRGPPRPLASLDELRVGSLEVLPAAAAAGGTGGGGAQASRGGGAGGAASGPLCVVDGATCAPAANAAAAVTAGGGSTGCAAFTAGSAASCAAGGPAVVPVSRCRTPRGSAKPALPAAAASPPPAAAASRCATTTGLPDESAAAATPPAAIARRCDFPLQRLDSATAVSVAVTTGDLEAAATVAAAEHAEPACIAAAGPAAKPVAGPAAGPASGEGAGPTARAGEISAASSQIAATSPPAALGSPPTALAAALAAAPQPAPSLAAALAGDAPPAAAAAPPPRRRRRSIVPRAFFRKTPPKPAGDSQSSSLDSARSQSNRSTRSLDSAHSRSQPCLSAETQDAKGTASRAASPGSGRRPRRRGPPRAEGPPLSACDVRGRRLARPLASAGPAGPAGVLFPGLGSLLARTWNDIVSQAPDLNAWNAGSAKARDDAGDSGGGSGSGWPAERERPTVAPVGFSFSPAGLLLPYHLGVAQALADLGALTEDTPIAGASAGALAVATVACAVPVERSLGVLYQVNDNLRRHGAARRLHAAIETHLESLLPEDAVARFNDRPGRAAVAFTQVWPGLRGHNVAAFRDIADLKQCLVASCNIPFYFSTWPTVTCRGVAAVDGYFATSRREFGCPETSAARDVRVVPFSPRNVRLKFAPRSCISPDLQAFDAYQDQVSNGLFARRVHAYLERCPAPRPAAVETPAEEQRVEAALAEQRQRPRDGPRGIAALFAAAAGTAAGGKSAQIDEEAAVTNLGFMWGVRSTLSGEEVGGAAAPSSDLAGATVAGDGGGGAGTGLPATAAAAVAEHAEAAETDLPRRHLPTLPYSMRVMLRYALDAPARDDVVLQLYDLGRVDALRWLHNECMLPGPSVISDPAVGYREFPAAVGAEVRRRFDDLLA